MDRSVTIAAAAPFAVGALVPVHAVLGADSVCPFRSLTGAPCPFCGATRAFVLVAHLDSRWVEYGAVWVVAAVALLLLGRRMLGLVPVLATFAVAWAWALGHATTIVS